MVRISELRTRWGVSRQTIYNWRREGLLPKPVRLGPNVVAFALEDIERFEAERPRA